MLYHVHLAAATCNPLCVNGECVEGNQCVCYAGWTGDICDNGRYLNVSIAYIKKKPLHPPIGICIPDCVNGNCSGPNVCLCNPGWTGSRCRVGQFVVLNNMNKELHHILQILMNVFRMRHCVPIVTILKVLSTATVMKGIKLTLMVYHAKVTFVFIVLYN